jgi:hypothetical protein
MIDFHDPDRHHPGSGLNGCHALHTGFELSWIPQAMFDPGTP